MIARVCILSFVIAAACAGIGAPAWPQDRASSEAANPLVAAADEAKKQADDSVKTTDKEKSSDVLMRELSSARNNIVRVQTMVRKEIDRNRDLVAAARDESRSNDLRLQGVSFTLHQLGADTLKDEDLPPEIAKRKKDVEALTADYDKKVAAAQEAAKPGSFPDFVPANPRLTTARTELTALQALVQYRDTAKQTQDKLAASDKLIRLYEGIVTDLDYTLQRIDDRLQVLLQDNQRLNFYTTISTVAFAALVAVVIISFFGIALRSKTVRNAIFTGESGIQFVTLFSLVIAIILFGILRILEGKELAALLGGLSGYILGRGTGTNSAARRDNTSTSLTPASTTIQTPAP